jgi:putative transposase
MRERKRLRLQGFDYSRSGYYYFTICVKDRIWSFGTITDKSMQLSQNGIIALEQWHWLGDQYPYIRLVSFVVMPNHVHGIIFIDAAYCWSENANQFKIKPLPELLGAYKTTVSKRIHLAGDTGFKWQNAYHDHIIRNAKSLKNIQDYIKSNPEKWTGV